MEISKNLQMFPTADPEEIKKFNALANNWLDARGPRKTLHQMNKLRIPLVRDGLIESKVLPESARDKKKSLEGIKILDVGCGGGILSVALGSLGATVVGLDAASKLIEIANKHLATQEEVKDCVTFVYEPIEEHCKKFPEQYDAVIASEVVEHIVDKQSFLEACIKTLKPGGSFFLTTPNRGLTSWFFNKLLGEYIFRIMTVGTHDFNLFISPDDVSKILKGFGCKTMSVKGMRYVLGFWQNEWTFQNFDAIHYALHAVKEKK